MNMNSITTSIWDRLGVGLSTLCMIHCLALPIFLSVLPSVPLFESLHGWTHPVFAALILPTVIQASRHAGSTLMGKASFDWWVFSADHWMVFGARVGK